MSAAGTDDGTTVVRTDRKGEPAIFTRERYPRRHVKIIETVCGGCGAKDSLVPVRGEEGVWRCKNCGEVFEETAQD